MCFLRRQGNKLHVAFSQFTIFLASYVISTGASDLTLWVSCPAPLSVLCGNCKKELTPYLEITSVCLLRYHYIKSCLDLDDVQWTAKSNQTAIWTTSCFSLGKIRYHW
ncbi:hypothetical protein L798_09354 [Zootermopsis nevadensis]|uniref:Uncharacterized protein n=1 Tax=Zootermopsis nevadensis TaxID=136037 RepID=A0A067R1V9_ZOONE|nr:hypothetical protein L798_09354 [Zootermopsis nevadensis]